MDEKELLTELLDFLDASGKYHEFIGWEIDRGYDKSSVEDAVDEAREL